MIRRSDITVSDSFGTPEPGVYITVKDSLGALASLFDDAAAPLGNPIVSGIGGAFYYNVATPGTYTEEYRLSLLESPRTIRAVSLTASGVGDADYGDITVSGSGTIWTIDPGAVTLAKQANMATASVVYRKTAGAGPPEVQTLATLKTDLGLTGTNSGDQTITLTGAVTGSGTGSFVTTIANDAVTYAKMQNVSATARFIGRITAGAGDPEELTGTQATTLLDSFTSALQGLAPASGGGTVNFLRADGTWQNPVVGYATQAYVDSALAGLSWKTACRIASTANLTLSGLTAIDGVTPVAGDRILAKDQTTASQNGIYVAAAGAWTRATDADSGAELVNASCYISEGTANADKQFVCTTNGPITVGTTALAFTTFTAGATAWGSITGTLSSQTDLQTALNGKAASGANTDITALDQDITITATGTIAANTIGFRGLPQNAQTAAYTLALTDAGKHISITTGGVTVPANASVAFPIGTAISIYNDSAANQSIAITTDTMYLGGTATTGTRTLAQRGIATVVKVATTTWVISGAGLT